MDPQMHIVVITGMSGAGKSLAANILEDMGYYCVDNMPVALLTKFAEFCLAARGVYENVALVTDIRGGESFAGLCSALDEVSAMGFGVKLIFLEADAETLIRRYKESRRRHPLETEGTSTAAAVMLEREKLLPLRERADEIVDTSSLTINEFRERMNLLFGWRFAKRRMQINIISFGYKFGAPTDADLVIDVRFLPNPFYISELKALTGEDKAVSDYVFSFDLTREFMRRFMDLLEFLIPNYSEEGKSHLNIAIGCTGGKHRSVAVAARVAELLGDKASPLTLLHRDLNR